jgi:polysaccharide biosynthesis/export protein
MGLCLGLTSANAQVVPHISAEGSQSSLEYRLGSGDGVRVVVFLNPELATDSRVSEQGEINFPLIGLIKIGGLSIPAAEKLIANQLKEGGFVQKPQVLLSITAYRSQLVSVLGNVVKPGRYPLETPGTKLTELLAVAGGIAQGGSDIAILVRQAANNIEEKIEIDIPSIYLDGKGKLDVQLRSGDSIYIHKQPNFYISGSVGRPGVYNVDRGLSIGQAIAKGGGYTLRSRESGVRLMRRDTKGVLVERVPLLNEMIQPEDHIFIRESLF